MADCLYASVLGPPLGCLHEVIAGSAATTTGTEDGTPEYQFPLMDGHDHVVVAGYSPFTDSQRFHRESRFPRSLPAALGLETPTLPGMQAYAGF